jgi:hypothetical protein
VVYLDNVPNFHVKGGVIHDAYIGILSQGNSNIILSKGATLMNNGIAANMKGVNANDKVKAALFFMDCSYMTDNAIGISGQDVVLAIDESVNSNNKNLNTFSNFEEDKIKGLYFDIYHTFNPVTKLPNQYYANNQVQATNNRWTTGLPEYWTAFCSFPYSSREYDLLQGFNKPGSWLASYQLVVSPDAPTDLKVDCHTIGEGDDPHKVPPSKQGQVSTIGGSSTGLGFVWSGINAMLNGNIDEMKSAFTPLAMVSNEERNSSENGYTQLYIDIAKALVYVPTSDVPFEIDGRNSKDKPTLKQSILVYPNPAHQWLTVDLPNQTHKLQLVDGLGRSVYSESVNGTTRLNVGQYPSGVYHVIVTDAKGVQTRSKVIVQHD